MSYYRLNASSRMTLANQTFDDTLIAGQSGKNIVNIANSSDFRIDNQETFEAVSQHTIILSNKTITVNSISKEE